MTNKSGLKEEEANRSETSGDNFVTRGRQFPTVYLGTTVTISEEPEV